MLRYLSWLSFLLVLSACFLALIDGAVAGLAVLLSLVLAGISLLGRQTRAALVSLEIGGALILLFWMRHFHARDGWISPTSETLSAYVTLAAGPLLVCVVCFAFRYKRDKANRW